MRTTQLAWRNIWRNRRRTLVTVGAMTLALLVTILYSSMTEGYLVQIERDTLDFEVGAVQIFGRGYQDNPSIYTAVKDDRLALERLGQQGINASGRYLGAGLVAHGDTSAGAEFRGIDASSESRVLVLGQQVMHGRWVDDSDHKGVVLGRKLSDTLGVTVGAELVLLSQAADGSMANDLFEVRGILKSVGETTDRAGLFMTQQAYRDLLAYDGSVHQIIVGRPEVLELNSLEQTVLSAVGDNDVQTWRQLQPTLATMLDSMSAMVAFLFFIVNVVIAIVILNAMLMAVYERIKEFGVLKAIGYPPMGVVWLIYMESLFQVALAIVAGLLLAVPSLWYLATVGIDTGSLAGVSAMGMAMASTWYAEVNSNSFVGPIVMLVCVVLLAIIYPAVKAAVIQPVAAMRHQ